MSATLSSSPEQRLLRAIPGTHDESNGEQHIVTHLQAITGAHLQGIIGHLSPQYYTDCDPFHRFVEASCELVLGIRDNPRISLDKALVRLQTSNVFAATDDAQTQLHMKDGVFAIMLWLSHIAVPCPKPSTNSFKIDTQGAKYATFSSGYEYAAETRPLQERREEAKKFQVASINADTLKQVAKMEFIWVDSISAHLDLNPSIPALYLFKAPSFCKLQSSDASFLLL